MYSGLFQVPTLGRENNHHGVARSGHQISEFRPRREEALYSYTPNPISRTKNTEPTSTYSYSTHETHSSQPNFVLLGPPQTKKKHNPSGTPKISTTVKWQTAAKKPSGTNPDAPVYLEKDENAPVQGIEKPVVVEKVVTSSKIEKSPAKKIPRKKVVDKREKSEVVLPLSGKQLKGLKKRKHPCMIN